MNALSLVVAAVSLFFVVLWGVVLACRRPPGPAGSDAPELPDEAEWYDAAGNHRYYDRKIIRREQRLQQKNRGES